MGEPRKEGPQTGADHQVGGSSRAATATDTHGPADVHPPTEKLLRGEATVTVSAHGRARPTHLDYVHEERH